MDEDIKESIVDRLKMELTDVKTASAMVIIMKLIPIIRPTIIISDVNLFVGKYCDINTHSCQICFPCFFYCKERAPFETTAQPADTEHAVPWKKKKKKGLGSFFKVIADKAAGPPPQEDQVIALEIQS